MAQPQNPNFFNVSNGSQPSSVTSRQSTVAQQTTGTTTQAPPNAAVATTAKTFVGLCEALNQAQQEWVRDGKYEVADVYEIIFKPASLANAVMKKPGLVDYSQTPNPYNDTANQKLDPNTNSVLTTSRIYQITAGTQIVQVIDQVLKNSSYIIDQQLYTVDEVTGKVKPQARPIDSQVAWYKINVMSQPIKYDTKRRDYAYKMTYLITPYAVNNMQSPWFPKSRFRGLHKTYDYWFTGKNTQILNFEQDYNNLYRLVLSGQNVPLLKTSTSNNRDITRWTYAAASAQSSQGAGGETNEPAANAADYLYSPSDQAKVRLRIVGDPAWMQQGEVAVGVAPDNFSFQPFNNDGTINYDSSEIVFDINWNRPADYDFNTCIVKVNSSGQGNQPQENLTYTAIRCKNFFNKGKFEQEIEGRLLVEFLDNITGNPAATGSSVPSAPGRIPQNTAPGTEILGRTVQVAPNGEPAEIATTDSAPQPLPAGPAGDPTSTGAVIPVPTNQPVLLNTPQNQTVVNSDSSNSAAQAIAQDDSGE